MKIKVIYRKDQANNNGACPLVLRLTHDRKVKFLALGVSVNPEQWNDAEQRVASDDAVNLLISSKLSDLHKRIAKLEALDIEVNFDNLLGARSKRINCTISDYFNQQIERMQSIGKIGTAGKYRYCLRLLSQCNPVNIRFEQVDMAYLRDFETFLLSKANASNSVATKFSVLKAVYNRAIADGIFEPRDNPFAKFKVGKYWKPTRKRAITKEDVLKIKALELPTGGSFYLEFARDLFLFSYYTAGSNFKDIATLRWSDLENGRIRYRRHKTSKEMSCLLMPEAQHIISKYACTGDYIFPILSDVHRTERQIFDRIHKVLAKVNANLRVLSEMLGLKTPLTTYVARHTYATVLKRSGVNIAIISESLGHSDLATTQIYLDSFENSQIDEAMKNLL